MPYRKIVWERRGTTASITLACPERGNRLDEATLGELAAACRDAADAEEVRAVILAAQGPAFCLGWEEPAAGEEDAALMERLRSLADGFEFLAGLPCPVIAAIGGDALSAGLELALACDLRLASPAARFGLPEAAQGLLPMAGGTQRLPRLAGRAVALEMILAGETIDAQEARRVGLVNALVPQEGLLGAAEALAGRIAQRGPLAVRYAKEAVRRGLDVPLAEALRLETDLTIILQTTEDRAEGVRAFLEKRPPCFHGR